MRRSHDPDLAWWAGTLAALAAVVVFVNAPWLGAVFAAVAFAVGIAWGRSQR